MTKINKNLMLEATAHLYAQLGHQAFSIRALAKELGIAPSVIYHYFTDEDHLLRSMFDYTNTQLGHLRKNLIWPNTAKEMLKQRIGFQIDQSEKIVAVLKYYLMYRQTFKKNGNGFVPDKSALHIEEVLAFGASTKEFHVVDLKEEAKFITHAINGFLLEYFPYKPTGTERQQLIHSISRFILRGLTNSNTITN